MTSERERAAKDVERSLAIDAKLRELNAVSLDYISTSITLAHSMFPSDATKQLYMLQFLILHPDAQAIEIAKQGKAIRQAA